MHKQKRSNPFLTVMGAREYAELFLTQESACDPHTSNLEFFLMQPFPDLLYLIALRKQSNTLTNKNHSSFWKTGGS